MHASWKLTVNDAVTLPVTDKSRSAREVLKLKKNFLVAIILKTKKYETNYMKINIIRKNFESGTVNKHSKMYTKVQHFSDHDCFISK